MYYGSYFNRTVDVCLLIRKVWIVATKDRGKKDRMLGLLRSLVLTVQALVAATLIWICVGLHDGSLSQFIKEMTVIIRG